MERQGEYTNDDNPFGDSNLHETFVWKKKYEKMGVKKITKEEITEINKQKVTKNREELEKVKQRRLEREKEREEREIEMQREQREREADQFKEWAKQEEVFDLKQARLRSKLRMKEGRAKTVDILARYINVFGDSTLPSELEESINSVESSNQKIQRHTKEDEEELLDRIYFLQQTEILEPYKNLNGLRKRDMEELESDIDIYLQLDSGSHTNAEYWKDLKVIVQDELAKLNIATLDPKDDRRREGINPSVSADIAKILEGKTTKQLKTLQRQVEKKVASQEQGIDIEYWETLLSRLKAQISGARLRQFHDEHFNMKDQLLKKFEGLFKSIKPDFDVSLLKRKADTFQEPSTSKGPSKGAEDELRFLTTKELQAKCLDDYRARSYSPPPIPIEKVSTDNVVIAQGDRHRELEDLRAYTLRKLQSKPVPIVQFATVDDQKKDKKDKNVKDKNFDRNNAKMSSAEEKFVSEARKGMDDDEAIFSVEEERSTLQNYSWAEKYRPRKPRYFNRVHTGFEWNKYNQTHYDIDNPPPKVVQGYKFNIFYPDLIDKGSTPQYKVTVCKEEPEFAFIRFSAGPPYEDVCFKIVNREWNYSYKAGFKSQFQNNILQLWFHFKRLRYRR